MKIIAKTYLKSSLAAKGMTALLATLTLFIKPLFMLMGGGIALVTMSVGLSEGLAISLIAVIINVSANWAIAGDWQGGLLFSLLLLVPLVASSYYLSLRFDLAEAVTVVAGFVLFLAGSLAVTVSDSFWLGYLQNVTSFANLKVNPSLLEAMAPFMNSTICFLVFLVVTLSLFLGRYWQSQIYKKGAFSREFLQYRISPLVAAITLAFIALALLDIPPFKDVTWVLIGLFVIQGLAVIHFFVSIKKWPAILLIFLYFCLLFLPSLILAVLMLGLVDVLLNLRYRLSLSQ